MVLSSGKSQGAGPQVKQENGYGDGGMSPYEGSMTNAPPALSNAGTPADHLGGQQQLRHFPVLSPTWTVEELRVLEEGLSKYPADRNSTVSRYVMIAATLPDKMTRDVALRCKWMMKKENGKRKREDTVGKKGKDKKFSQDRTEQSSRGTLGPPPPRPGLSVYNPTPTVEFDGVITNEAIGGTTGELLDQNAQILSQIKGNLVVHKVQENSDLFLVLKDNILNILNGMTNMPGIMSQMPPLPVKLNLELAGQILPKAGGQHAHHHSL